MFSGLSRRVKKFWASLALLSVQMAIVLVLTVAASVLFVYIARYVFSMKRTRLDDRVFEFMGGFVNDRNSAVVKALTYLGTHEFLIPANLVLIGFFLFIRKHKWHSIKLPAIALSSVALMFILKRSFNRERPDVPLLFEARGLSFPSGHALMSMTFYGLLIYLIYKSAWRPGLKWTLMPLLALLILTIGLTRIYLRVHYASDVVAGYCIGLVWLVFSIWLLNHLEKWSRQRFDRMVQRPSVAEGGA